MSLIANVLFSTTLTLSLLQGTHIREYPTVRGDEPPRDYIEETGYPGELHPDNHNPENHYIEESRNPESRNPATHYIEESRNPENRNTENHYIEENRNPKNNRIPTGRYIEENRNPENIRFLRAWVGLL